MMPTRIAFLSPGQGRLPDAFPSVPQALDDLVVLMRNAGLPVDAWAGHKHRQEPVGTDVAQPMLLLDLLIRETRLRAAGWNPDCTAGHSLGEYAALVCAGVLDKRDAMQTVIQRGRFMQEIRGSMSAILKLDLEVVAALCEGTQAVVANHNAPGQIVISGPQEHVTRVAERAEAEGARCIPLQVSGPFHSPLMRPAERRLEPVVRDLVFSPPSVPIASGVSGRIENDAKVLRLLLLRQITSPVRWVDVTKALEAFGVTLAVEVGAGDVLTRLGRRSGANIRFLTYEEALNERG
jgi:[acyl-carrier-protein] S-malonyltransferase